VGKIAEIAVYRSVYLTIWHRILVLPTGFITSSNLTDNYVSQKGVGLSLKISSSTKRYIYMVPDIRIRFLMFLNRYYIY